MLLFVWFNYERHTKQKYKRPLPVLSSLKSQHSLASRKLRLCVRWMCFLLRRNGKTGQESNGAWPLIPLDMKEESWTPLQLTVPCTISVPFLNSAPGGILAEMEKIWILSDLPSTPSSLKSNYELDWPRAMFSEASSQLKREKKISNWNAI